MYHISEDVGADGMIIPYLKCIFEKYVVRMLIELSLLRIISSGRILWRYDESTCSVKAGNFLTGSACQLLKYLNIYLFYLFSVTALIV
jgi:hypothetical protein